MAINSANMSLPIPQVGIDQGPAYALNIDNCLTLVDQHDHSPTHGVPITPSGLNISSDLSFLGHSATNLFSSQFYSQAAPLASSYVASLYVSNGDLFYNNNAGTAVQLTIGAAVGGTPGAITNLVSPAGIIWNTSAPILAPAFQLFTNTTNDTFATLEAGSIILHNTTAGGKAMTINPPLAMPANKSITLPTPPSQDSYTIISPSGAISTLPRGAVQSAGSLSGTGLIVDWSVSPAQSATIAAACTFSSLSNGINGESYMLLFVQGAGGPFAVTWPSNVKWPGGTAPTFSASGTDIVNFFFDGTNYFGTVAFNFS